MLRMEAAVFCMLAFLAGSYLLTEKRETPLHRTFTILMIMAPIHLLLDGATLYTVNHMDTVPLWLNNLLHRLFIGTMVFVIYLFYQYLAILVEEETGKPRRLDLAALVYLIAAEVGVSVIPVHYAITPYGNYSDGPHASFAYSAVAVNLLLSICLMVGNWKQIEKKKKIIISIGLMVEVVCGVGQLLNPLWLSSGLGIGLMVLSLYLTIENPDILRADLIEQRMSMLYLKSQINPHFLYNTLDTIRIRAQLDGNKEVADSLRHLASFYRMTVKVNTPMVEVETELEMIETYLSLMKLRYADLEFEITVDPDLENCEVPNFILQPIVENSLLHGLKNKGYKGKITVTVRETETQELEIMVSDTGSGFEPGQREQIEKLLAKYNKREANTMNNDRIGMLNVHRRIKLLCGRNYGLHYTENPDGGVTAHMILPLKEG